MGISRITNEELKARKVEELKKLLDKFAGLAMQSLMQHWMRFDENGFERADSPNPKHFLSLAGRATSLGWGEWHPDSKSVHSLASKLANEAYFIAESMIVQRRFTLENLSDFDISEFIENLDCKGDIGDAEATEETTCSTNTSWPYDDGGPVLGVHSVKPAADVSQVGSS